MRAIVFSKLMNAFQLQVVNSKSLEQEQSFSKGSAFKQLASIISIQHTLGQVWELCQPLAHQLCLQYLWVSDLPVKKKKTNQKHGQNRKRNKILLIAGFKIHHISGSLGCDPSIDNFDPFHKHTYWFNKLGHLKSLLSF